MAKDTATEREVRQRHDLLHRELERFLELLVDRPGLERIIVFGSLAGGPMHAWSDVDLVIVERTDLPFLQRLREMRRVLKPRVATDLFVYTPDEFESLCRERQFFQS